MIKNILRFKYQGNLSHERIALSLSISKEAVSKYLTLQPVPGLIVRSEQRATC
jgi:predicted transcriptional regulator